jgi:hypothetical protein
MMILEKLIEYCNQMCKYETSSYINSNSYNFEWRHSLDEKAFAGPTNAEMTAFQEAYNATIAAGYTYKHALNAGKKASNAVKRSANTTAIDAVVNKKKAIEECIKTFEKEYTEKDINFFEKITTNLKKRIREAWHIPNGEEEESMNTTNTVCVFGPSPGPSNNNMAVGGRRTRKNKTFFKINSKSTFRFQK